MTCTVYLPFESSVVLDGTKTVFYVMKYVTKFESSVVLDGTKTKGFFCR